VFRNCDLSRAELSKATLTGGRLHGSRLDDLRGGDGLRGVRIGSEQVIPVAHTVFSAFGIVVEDDDDD
jgi:hypothetical protein